MEPHLRYALVGLFVLVLSGIFLVTSLWLVGIGPRGEYRTFAIYPPESVAGIANESLVKYQGLEVGKVREIAIDQEDPRRIRVLIDIRRDVPILVDTTARMASQGMTGLLYFIELHSGQPGSPPLEAEPGAAYPVIPSLPSDFSQLRDLGNELLKEAKGALAEVKGTLALLHRLVGTEQQDQIRAMIGDVSQTATALAAAARTLKGQLERLDPLLGDLAAAGASLPGLTSKAGQTLDAAGEAASDLGQTARRLETLATQVSPGLKTLSQEGMPELVALLRDLRALTVRLDRLAEDLERDPNLLIQGRPRRPGPGER